MNKNIMQIVKECYLCRKLFNVNMQTDLECHHIFGGANRPLSTKDGLVVWLCQRHHNTAPYGVHFNQKNMEILRQDGQKRWEQIYGTRDEFLKKYGKNYL